MADAVVIVVSVVAVECCVFFFFSRQVGALVFLHRHVKGFSICLRCVVPLGSIICLGNISHRKTVAAK